MGPFLNSIVNSLDKLTLILPEAPNGVTDEQVAQTVKAVSAARQEFQYALHTSNLSGARSIHLSSVHTLADVQVHAILLCLPSVGKIKEVRAKGFLTYFAHWLDDICDSGFLQSAIRKDIENGNTPEIQNVLFGSRDKNLEPFVQQVLGRIGPCSFLKVGFTRLMLGSAIFHRGRLAQSACNLHNELIDKTLDDRGKLRSRFRNQFVDLTTKTLQELWLGLEDDAPKFRLAFLYSLLSAPALLYHDYKEEIQRGEVAANWGSISEAAVTKHIEDVGEELQKMKDRRRSLRAWQIRALACSFAGVLPPKVQEAYDEVARKLNSIPPGGKKAITSSSSS